MKLGRARGIAAIVMAAVTVFVTAARADAVKIAPIYFSTSPNKQTYLRLVNLTNAAGSVTITLRNSAGVSLGSWTTTVAANAAPQLGMATIEAGAKATPPAAVGGAVPTGSIEVTSTFEGQLQHVVYNPVGGALTNLSLCFNASTDTQNLTNVHTSLLIATYPSSITFNNTGDTAAASVAVSDALTGTLIGQYTSAVIPAGGALTVPETDIETQLGFAPAQGQFHLNLKLSGAFTGTMSHTVDNLIAGVMTDMTARCRMAPG